MSRPRVAFAALGLVAAAALGASVPEAATVAAGTADGWLEVAKERTALRHAWVLGESGDGASDALRVILCDRELSADALLDAEARDELAAADSARCVVADLPGEGAELELFLHHPRLPAGISLVGLAKFVPESVTAARLEGRLHLPGATAIEVWFSAPIERRERAAAPEELPERPVRPLDEAIREGSEEEFEAALAANPALDAPLGGGMTPLAVAADAGNLYAVRRLLESGAAVDHRVDRSAMSPLMLAAGRESVDILSALLAAGANPKLRTSSGFTPLLHAVIEGRTDNVRHLIAAGADVARDRELLIRTARERGHGEVAAMLESATPP